MKKIVFIASDYSSISGITGGLEIFRIANVLTRIKSPGKPQQFDCTVASLEVGRFSISPGLMCEFSKEIDIEERFDAIILIGFIYQDINQLIKKINSSREAVSWIRNQYSSGALIGASCSATLLLAETGLLDGKSATTSWWLNSFFKKRYPKIKLEIDELIVENERLICSGALTSYLNLVLCIIEKLTDKSLALSCSKMMLIDINRNSQAPYIMQQKLLDYSDDMVTKAQHWLYTNFQNKVDFKVLDELVDFHIDAGHRAPHASQHVVPARRNGTLVLDHGQHGQDRARHGRRPAGRFAIDALGPFLSTEHQTARAAHRVPPSTARREVQYR